MQEIAVVIPTYKARSHILGVINEIGPEVARIYVVVDCCPDDSGDFVAANCKDGRVSVIKGPTMSATKDCSMLELSHTRALA